MRFKVGDAVYVEKPGSYGGSLKRVVMDLSYDGKIEMVIYEGCSRTKTQAAIKGWVKSKLGGKK